MFYRTLGLTPTLKAPEERNMWSIAKHLRSSGAEEPHYCYLIYKYLAALRPGKVCY